MKIKIIAQIPVEEHIRPITGEVYEVMGTETRGRTGEIYLSKSTASGSECSATS